MMAARRRYEGNTTLLKAHHVFYTIAIVGNLIVTTVYWPLLHAKTLQRHSASPIKQWHAVAIHSVPMIVCASNAAVTNTVLGRDFYRIWTVISFCFILMWLYVGQVLGRNVYWFLDFKDKPLQAVGVSIAIVVLFNVVYQALVKLDVAWKRKAVVDYNKKSN